MEVDPFGHELCQVILRVHKDSSLAHLASVDGGIGNEHEELGSNIARAQAVAQSHLQERFVDSSMQNLINGAGNMEHASIPSQLNLTVLIKIVWSLMSYGVVLFPY
ncbi:hypothetical protein VNO78_19440 [Psophocarpus tetragonolobus]|uniref:Uncharacterized protein n=1 Tax=Psophocarpus tetragonolobus TaxID=3891 RepID=A0AAN9XFV6_PSOTE